MGEMESSKIDTFPVWQKRARSSVPMLIQVCIGVREFGRSHYRKGRGRKVGDFVVCIAVYNL